MADRPWPTRRRIALVVMLTFFASALLCVWSTTPFRIIAPIAFILATVELVMDLHAHPDPPRVAWLGVPFYLIATYAVGADQPWTFFVGMLLGLPVLWANHEAMSAKERTS